MWSKEVYKGKGLRPAGYVNELMMIITFLPTFYTAALLQASRFSVAHYEER